MDSNRDYELPDAKRIKLTANNTDATMGGTSVSDSPGKIAQTLAGMRINTAIHGSTYCSPVANCTLAHAKGYIYNPAVYGTEKNFYKMLREDETKQFKDHDPEMVMALNENEKEIKNKAKTKAPEMRGPFCCSGMKHVPRLDSAHLDNDKHEHIMAFVKHINDDKDFGWVGGDDEVYTDEQLKAVDKVIRIHRVEDDHNKATYIFTVGPDPTTDDTSYTMIYKVDGGMKFETTGPNGYLGFFCSEHEKKYHVGYSYKNMLGKKKTIASFKDDRLDKILKVGKMKPLVLGYGGPGW